MSRVSTLIICLSICDVTDTDCSPPLAPRTGCKIQQINEWFRRPNASYDMPGSPFHDIGVMIDGMVSGTKSLENSILVGAMNHFDHGDFDDLCRFLDSLEWTDSESNGAMCVHDERPAQFWSLTR